MSEAKEFVKATVSELLSVPQDLLSSLQVHDGMFNIIGCTQNRDEVHTVYFLSIPIPCLNPYSEFSLLLSLFNHIFHVDW